MNSSADAPTPAAIEMRGVSKAFGALVANRNVSLHVKKGTLHALVGENGAGKSTCMKMLYGLYQPDAGEILIHGKAHAWSSPRDAIAAGLGMVHQHFMLAGPYSGLDNIILGDEPTKGGLWRLLPRALRPIDRAAARRRLAALAEAYRFPVDLDQPIETLPVGLQQRLEILKLLYRDVDILILDEPTAVLTPQEVDDFFANLKQLKAQGKTIIVITHKLNEVLQHADHVSVLRRGEIVAEQPTAGLTAPQLAELMVGRAVQLQVTVPPPPQLGEPRLVCQGLTLARSGDKPRLKNLTFSVHGGEIVGVAGIEGNGQSEFLQLLLDPHDHFGGHHHKRQLVAGGQLQVLGKDVRRFTGKALRRLGVGFVPEDRHQQGLLLSQDLQQNFLLGLTHLRAFARYGFIRTKHLRQTLHRAVKEFDVRPAQPQALAVGLSGGNQQKLIIAREFIGQPELFVCAQPTRGVDVGSIEFIHQRIVAARSAGTAVLLVSSSLEEIIALADRILVFYEGQVVATLRRGEADEATLGRYMGGGHG